MQKKKAQTRKPTPPPPPPLVQQLVEMGFSRSRAEYALKELADEEEPRAEVVVTWLIDHPDIEVRVQIGCVQTKGKLHGDCFWSYIDELNMLDRD